MSLVVLSREQFYEKARKLFGNNPLNWVFVCPWCKFEQSMESIKWSINLNGFHQSKRYGRLTKQNIKKRQPKVSQECLASDCDYVSYGLISGNLEVDGQRYLELAPRSTSKVKP